MGFGLLALPASSTRTPLDPSGLVPPRCHNATVARVTREMLMAVGVMGVVCCKSPRGPETARRSYEPAPSKRRQDPLSQSSGSRRGSSTAAAPGPKGERANLYSEILATDSSSATNGRRRAGGRHTLSRQKTRPLNSKIPERPAQRDCFARAMRIGFARMLCLRVVIPEGRVSDWPSE